MAENADLIAELRARIAELTQANRTLETAQKELSGQLASAQKEVKDRTKALEAAEALAAKVPDLEKASSEAAKQLKAMEAGHVQALAAKDAEFGRTLAFTQAGVKDPAWQKVFLERFQEQAEKGEADIGKWIEGLYAADPKTLTDGVLAAAVNAHRPTQKVEPLADPAGGANPWAGRGGAGVGFPEQNDGKAPTAHPNAVTDARQIEAMLHNPQALRENAAALANAHPHLAVLAQPGFLVDNPAAIS